MDLFIEICFTTTDIGDGNFSLETTAVNGLDGFNIKAIDALGWESNAFPVGTTSDGDWFPIESPRFQMNQNIDGFDNNLWANFWHGTGNIQNGGLTSWTFTGQAPTDLVFHLQYLNPQTGDGCSAWVTGRTKSSPSDPPSPGCSGPIANTPTGSNVSVQPSDITTGGTPVTLSFTDVTQAGDTSLTTSGVGPPPPAGFKLGNPPTYFDLTTTATFSGPVTICIDYSGLSFGNESQLKLFHIEDNSWVDRTISLDTANKIICASVSSFSAFAIFESAPVANAGPDQTVQCSCSTATSVTLDGSASYAPGGGALTYTWTGPFPQGGGTVTGVDPAITLPIGTSTIALVVNDGQVDSAPSYVRITVMVQVVGLGSPLAPLVPEGSWPILPAHAFRQGRTLPLKMQMLCSGTVLTSSEVQPPEIVSLVSDGAPIDLAVMDIDSGQANDSGPYFRFSNPDWVYNLSTQILATGTYTIVVRTPDGQRYSAGFVLK